MATGNVELTNICERLRKHIQTILDDLPSLRSQANPSDPLAFHLVDRLLVATDNATGCVLLAEHELAAPLASVERSIFESLLASYWSSLKDDNAAVLLDAMKRETIRIMRLNLKEGHAEIRHTKTGADHTKEILDDPRMAEARRPPQIKMMAEQSGLVDVYDMLYGFMSMLAHGTATELLAGRDLGSLISASLHSVSALLRCIYLIAVNRIRENRKTKVEELGCWGLTEQKIHLSGHRSSVRTRLASEISFRTDLQKFKLLQGLLNLPFCWRFWFAKFSCNSSSFCQDFCHGRERD